MKYYELTPAYGRDYKTREQVIAAFEQGKDFEGDYLLDFRLVNKETLDSIGRPYVAKLRYRNMRQVAVRQVSSYE